jgi:hypothetical protein
MVGRSFKGVVQYGRELTCVLGIAGIMECFMLHITWLVAIFGLGVELSCVGVHYFDTKIYYTILLLFRHILSLANPWV